MIERLKLAQHALFGGLTEEQLALVLPHLRRESFEPGAWIIRQGEQGDRLYFIAEGGVQVSQTNPRVVILAELGVGEAFGEMELIDTQPRSASVQALTKLETYSLSQHDLHALNSEHPQIFTMIVLGLARVLCRRLRIINARLQS